MSAYTGYNIYLNYKKVIDILTEKEMTKKELEKESGIADSTMHKILMDLLKKNIIKIKRFDMSNGKTRILGIVKQ